MVIVGVIVSNGVVVIVSVGVVVADVVGINEGKDEGMSEGDSDCRNVGLPVESGDGGCDSTSSSSSSSSSITVGIDCGNRRTYNGWVRR
jgi:hypothetical protein